MAKGISPPTYSSGVIAKKYFPWLRCYAKKNSKNSKLSDLFENTFIMLIYTLYNMWQREFLLRLIVPELSLKNIFHGCVVMRKFEKFKMAAALRNHFHYAYGDPFKYVAIGIPPKSYSSGVIAIILSKKCKSSPFRGFRAIDSKMTENLKSWRNLRRNLFETMPIVFPVILSTIIEVFGKKNFLKKFPWAMDLVFFQKNSKNSKLSDRFENTFIMILETLYIIWPREFLLRLIVPELSHYIDFFNFPWLRCYAKIRKIQNGRSASKPLPLCLWRSFQICGNWNSP